MDSVYIETIVVGNIAGRLHPDPNVALRQRLTREWWATAPDRYNLVTSQLTFDECGSGDSTAAAERLDVLDNVPLLDQSVETEQLADLLIERGERCRLPSLGTHYISQRLPPIVYNSL